MADMGAIHCTAIDQDADEKTIANRKRAREAENPSAVGTSAAASGIPGPVVVRRYVQTLAAAPTVKRACKHCSLSISCTVKPSGYVHETNLRKHEQRCSQNPAKRAPVSGTIRDDPRFGSTGSGAEFEVEASVLDKKQRASLLLQAVHRFPDGSSHPVVGLQSGLPRRICDFFSSSTGGCCFPLSSSLLAYRSKPVEYRRLYGEDGLCSIAELRNERTSKMHPEPWSEAELRRVSLNFRGTVSFIHIPCGQVIDFCPMNVAKGQGPCRNCAGGHPDFISYDRSHQAYLDEKKLPWSTEPAASSLLRCHNGKVTYNCQVCSSVWQRAPNTQVNYNPSCPGCGERHQAEARTFELYQFVYASADMYQRGYAVLPEASSKRFDVASRNIKVIVETMSKRFHVDDGRLPHDTSDMLSAIRAGYVYIMVHDEDNRQCPEMENAWKRSVVHSLRMADADRTPRLLHVRRNASWDAYDCMRDAALEAGFAYLDVFCGHANAYATEKLPGETLKQTTLDPTEPT